MEKGVIQFAILFMLLCFLSTFRSVYGLKFPLIREECFSQVLSSENYNVWGTHSVVNTGRSWKKGYYDDAVKLLVIDPTGNEVFNSHGNLSWKFELKPSAGGVYLFCFINSAPRNLPVEFDLNIVSNTGNNISEHAKHDDFEILMLAVEELKYALNSILSEQDDLASQMKDQAIINEKMSNRAITKAMFESVALVGASVLQIFILRRFFEKKFSTFFLPR